MVLDMAIQTLLNTSWRKVTFILTVLMLMGNLLSFMLSGVIVESH